jgi:hypothetical protein
MALPSDDQCLVSGVVRPVNVSFWYWDLGDLNWVAASIGRSNKLIESLC